MLTEEKKIKFNAFEVGIHRLPKDELKDKLETVIADQKRRGRLHGEYVVVVEGNELHVHSKETISADAAKIIEELLQSIPQALVQQ